LCNGKSKCLTNIDSFIGLTAETSGKAQLGLGHSYSRAKVKFNVHRVDNMIIQTIALVDQLDKDINTFSMRIRYLSLLTYSTFYVCDIVGWFCGHRWWWVKSHYR